MKKKVLVLGATGMLGHQVVYRLDNNPDFEVVNVSYRNKLNSNTIILDLNNKSKLEDLLKDEKPTYVINCVGVLIKGANSNPANAIYLNSYLPHFLAQVCDDINAKLIHISTDCVFSGDKGGYTEKDEKDGKDIYAKTKALGEVENTKHLTLRTSIIGPELKENGEGLFHWFMEQEGETNGFTQAIWSGVTTTELAKVIEQSIKQELQGLYHVTNSKSINKFELLKLFKKETGKAVKINEVEGKAVNKSFVDTQRDLKRIIPSYAIMVQEMVQFMKENPTLYKNYNLG
ncbi:SDR family oxidoreductase [Mesonia ostreae]|uniref:dTDP-4-dehydrorhamnose reductase n=1 Tax=Mesonia ostreae TaxID=861110 RepID=A0ABU2KHA1_9FLAO|nr:SDR family oxidoreductase [Mesonia ostreae]MDT0294038.1 SDR family oxidoreductase [Mesonia ostreae]